MTTDTRLSSDGLSHGHGGYVFIVEDDYSVMDSLERELTSEGYRVYSFENPTIFLQCVTPLTPACLLLDMHLPEMMGTEVQARLKTMGIVMPVVFMSGGSTALQAVTALESGALQFLIKPFGREILGKAISKAMAHSRHEAIKANRIRIQQDRLERLTLRERQVLDLLLSGYTNKEISHKLEIANSTAKQHKGSILMKFEMSSVAELISLMRDP